MRFFTSCGYRIKFDFPELYDEVTGNSFKQCVSYHNCCVCLECIMLRIYSADLGSNPPTATSSFAYGPILMDLEYPERYRKS